VLFATGVAVLPHRQNRRRIPESTLTRANAPTEKRMDSNAMFLNCPAHMDKSGAVRCGLPAEVEYRYTMNSTDGPLESAKISCPRRHHFNGPIEYLTLPEQPAATAASAGRPSARGRSKRTT
jgi:hypothetical protein